MGKQFKQKIKSFKNPQTFPINKNKSFQQNINLFLKMLKVKHSKLDKKQYLNYIHNHVKKCRQFLPNYSQKIVVDTIQKIKICKKCQLWAYSNSTIVQCLLCDDYYHKNCSKKEICQDWICQNCQEVSIKKIQEFNKKQSYLNKNLKEQSKCSKCHSQKKEKSNNQLKYCFTCHAKYDRKCFGKGPAVCKDCTLKIQQSISQKKLKDYGFQNSSTKKNKSKQIKIIQKSQKQQDSQSTRQQTLQYNVLKYNYPQMSNDEINNYKKKLLFAIYSKKMQYSQKLKPINCQLDDYNQNSLDFSLMSLHPIDLKIYKKYKQQPIGPFNIEYKENVGYDVIAEMDLPKGMIVCEYIGDVITLRDAIKQQNDSLMELKVGCNADETLIICPKIHTNIARFINGINNETSKDKANVATLRNLVNGKPVVILYTIKKVKKGQSLLYDYNAGGRNAYDTKSFV